MKIVENQLQRCNCIGRRIGLRQDILEPRYLKGMHICECRCNERLKVKTDGSTHLAYTGFLGELEHLKIETRLIGESFECFMF